MKSVSYSTYTRLGCECRAEVIICLISQDKVTGGPFVEGTILSVDLVADTRGRSKFSYAVGYNDSVLIDPNQPIESGDINGIFCKDCFTDWVGQQVAQTCYIKYTCNPFYIYADTIPGADNKVAYFCGQGITGAFDDSRGGFIRVYGMNVPPNPVYTNNPPAPPALMWTDEGAVKIAAADVPVTGQFPRPCIQFWTSGKMRFMVTQNGEIRYLGSRAGTPDRAPGEPNCFQISPLCPDATNDLEVVLSASANNSVHSGAYLGLVGNSIPILAGRGAVNLEAGDYALGGIMDLGTSAPYSEYPPGSHYAGFPISGAIQLDSDGGHTRWVIGQEGELFAVPDSPGEGAHGARRIRLSRDNSSIIFGANSEIIFGFGVNQEENYFIRGNTASPNNKSLISITSSSDVNPDHSAYVTFAGTQRASHPGNIDMQSGTCLGARIDVFVRSPNGGLGLATSGGDVEIYPSKNTWYFKNTGNLESSPYNGGDIVFFKDDTGIKYKTNLTWSAFGNYVATPQVSSGYLSVHVGGVPYKILVAA